MIDFEGPTSFASIDGFYNGGTDSAGAAGPDLGVSFGLDALGLKNDELGPYFSNAPSPIGVLAPVGPSAAMNFSGGFRGLASFVYSSTAAATVSVWSGMNGNGTELGSFVLANNAQSNNCSDSPFCNWSLASFDIGDIGMARSITFGDAAGLAAFDNVMINTVAEAGTSLTFAIGIAMLGFAARRRRAG
jgi:hypothetical protein